MKAELIKSLKNYKKEYILSDILAGLMVAIIAMPLSIALGIQSVPENVSSYGINYGIVTAIIAGFCISCFGGSKYQIGGPTAAFVVILYGYLANPSIGIIGLALAGVFAGIILILMGILKLGRVMKIFPYPISIGFTTGIGITLIVGQLKDFGGFQSSGTSVIEKISSIVLNASTFQWQTFVVAALGLLIVVLLPKLNKKIPAAFVALIACTLLTILFNQVFGLEVETIGMRYGEIKAQFVLPNWSQITNVHIPSLIVPSFVIAFLCAIESLLSATVASGMTNTKYDANQELVGQGIANICSSLFGGLPATGAIARTAANIENKGKSPLSGIYHALFLLVMYFALMGVLTYVPLCVFSAILISVAINMSKFPFFAKLTKYSVKDTIILLVTCILTVLFDLTYGVLGAFALDLLMNIPNMKRKLSIEVSENIIFVSGPLFFLKAYSFSQTIKKVMEQYDIVIIDMSNVTELDLTCFQKYAIYRKNANKLGKEIELINMSENLEKKVHQFKALI